MEIDPKLCFLFKSNFRHLDLNPKGAATTLHSRASAKFAMWFCPPISSNSSSSSIHSI